MCMKWTETELLNPFAPALQNPELMFVIATYFKLSTILLTRMQYMKKNSNHPATEVSVFIKWECES